jgi:hypothetical protein
MNHATTDELTERPHYHPVLKARFESILDLAENTKGDVIKADEASL